MSKVARRTTKKTTTKLAARPSVSTRASKVPISNPTKPLFPSGFTKGEMIDYYERMAPILLPHLRGRALTLKRYPNGSDKLFFFEKNCPSHRPDWVETVRVVGRSADSTNDHCNITTRDGLRWVANLAAIELHVPLGKADKPDVAGAVAFDLDPGPGVSLIDCARLGIRMRDMLANIGLQCFAKTSGGKGFHLYVPLNGPTTFAQTKAFANMVAVTLAKDDPQRITASMSKADRPKRIFIDWSQNDRHKTTVCVYSIRARQTPSVSSPLTWDELEEAIAGKDEACIRFDAGAMLKRVERVGDLFKPVLTLKQKLPA